METGSRTRRTDRTQRNIDSLSRVIISRDKYLATHWESGQQQRRCPCDDVMHSFWQRLNALFFYTLSYLGFLAFAAAGTTYFHQPDPRINLSLKKIMLYAALKCPAIRIVFTHHWVTMLSSSVCIPCSCYARMHPPTIDHHHRPSVYI